MLMQHHYNQGYTCSGYILMIKLQLPSGLLKIFDIQVVLLFQETEGILLTPGRNNFYQIHSCCKACHVNGVLI